MVIMTAGSPPTSAVSGQAGTSSATAARGVSRSRRWVPAPTAWSPAYGRMAVASSSSDTAISRASSPARWMDLPVEDARHLLLSTASLSIVGYEHTLADPAIILWNDDHHVKPGA